MLPVLRNIYQHYLRSCHNRRFQFIHDDTNTQCPRVNCRQWYLSPIVEASLADKWERNDKHKAFKRYFGTKSSNGRLNCEDDSCTDKPFKWPSGERAKFNFHQDIEAVMNEQINVELKAFYCYLSMAAYFGRVDVALPGCESFFMQMHHEEHEHSLRFLNYVKMRGGMVQLCPILPPVTQDWKCPLNAFRMALQLEIEVGEKLVAVNSIAEKHGDLNASDFIITGFMEDQMKSVNEMGRLVTVLSGVGDQALARFVFDKDLLDNYVTSHFNVLKNKSYTGIANKIT